jgi:hypothetical protein
MVFAGFVGTNKTARPTLLDQRGPVACLMIRATCSSRQAEPRRVRSARHLAASRNRSGTHICLTSFGNTNHLGITPTVGYGSALRIND